MNKKILVNHYIVGDIMIYFFVNIVMYLVIIFFLIKYLLKRMNVISFVMIIFNMNIYLFFIYKSINFFYGILVAIVSLILIYFLNMFSDNNNEIILIKDGNINFHELINHYSYNRLVNYLRLHHITLDEIAYCVKKNNNLTIIRNKDIGYPVSIIVDGKLITENLKLINKNKDWLMNQLLEKHLLIKDIDYAYFKKNKIYFINN